MVREFVTRKWRAMREYNPRRIRVTRAPRPDSQGGKSSANPFTSRFRSLPSSQRVQFFCRCCSSY
jgi:hypothetical protein